MSFFDNLLEIQKILKFAGYELINEPYGFLEILRESKVHDCEIIAKKDYYKIIYLEVESNWRGIATDILKSNPSQCMVVTKYKDEYIFCSTLQDHITLHAKPRHVLIDNESKGYSWSNFVKLIKVNHEDDLNSIDLKVQNAFNEFSDYSDAVKKFGDNLEVIINKTKKMIDESIHKNSKYDLEAKKILEMCQEIINDKMELKDIQDMLLQHILTYKIFALVYDEQDFHNTNAVAKSLELLKNVLQINTNEIKYDKMELIAESITDSDQRQEFLKKFYETFYKKYDPDKAEKNGIVYTPNEVVKFMVISTDQLLKRHFGKSLSDENITILDPATGTGTFLVYVLKEIGIDNLESKYNKEIHANEISILPYYIATLNIEHTYKELRGKHKEFENICWMDTLDIGTKDYEKLTAYTEGNDNVKRISHQQKSKIHVVIGNPPYNATQTSFNNANPADAYPHIDKMIQEDYSKYSTVQNKNASVDMYKRFLKWSSERIKRNGMVVFVSNNSFLDAKADDGVRKALYKEFDYIYTVNLKGNQNINDWRRQGGKIFGSGAKIGISISFFIKTGENHSEIQYTEIEDYIKREEKLKWLDQHTVSTLKFKKIIPDEEAIWINQTDNDFEQLPSVLPRYTKESIFEDSCTGVTTGKDDWVFSINITNLEKKMKYYTSHYNGILKKYNMDYSKIKNLKKWIDKKIKWSDRTFQCLKQKRTVEYSDNCIKPTLYRPFTVRWQYYDDVITHRLSKFQDIFKNSQENLLICFPNPKTNVVFRIIGTNLISDYGCVDGTQNIPLYQYDDNGEKQSNITKYGLDLFQNHYKNKNIVDEDIFYYIYGIFNDPKYEEKYKFDLQRNFPRIPLAKNFERYSHIGKKLFDLHCNFDKAKEYELERVDKTVKKNNIKLQLKKEKENIRIIIDDNTTLENIPKEIYQYTLGSKNSLQWVLEFYKESKHEISKDSSDDEQVRKRFNTYKFSDHKEELITLLNKVTTVCLETVKLRKELEQLKWGTQPKLKFTPIVKKSEKTQKSNENKLEIQKSKPKSKMIKPKKTKSTNIVEYL